MTAKEAVTLFKREHFSDQTDFRRFAKRYYTRDCGTVVKIIAVRYKVSDKRAIKAIKEELMIEMESALAE